MAISLLDAWTSVAASSMSKTVSAGTDRMLVVCVGYEDGADNQVSGVTYGEQALTRANDGAVIAQARANLGGGFIAGSEVWYLLEAGIAAAANTTISVGFDAAVDNDMIHAASYEGVHQGGGAATTKEVHIAVTASSTPNPLSVTMGDAVDGDLVVGLATCGNASNYTWTGLAEQTERDDSSSTSSAAAALPSGSGDIVCAPTNSSQNRAATTAVVFAFAVPPEVNLEVGFTMEL